MSWTAMTTITFQWMILSLVFLSTLTIRSCMNLQGSIQVSIQTVKTQISTKGKTHAVIQTEACLRNSIFNQTTASLKYINIPRHSYSIRNPNFKIDLLRFRLIRILWDTLGALNINNNCTVYTLGSLNIDNNCTVYTLGYLYIDNNYTVYLNECILQKSNFTSVQMVVRQFTVKYSTLTVFVKHLFLFYPQVGKTLNRLARNAVNAISSNSSTLSGISSTTFKTEHYQQNASSFPVTIATTGSTVNINLTSNEVTNTNNVTFNVTTILHLQTTTTLSLKLKTPSENFDFSVISGLLLVAAVANIAGRPSVYGSFIGLLLFAIAFGTCILLWDKIKLLTVGKLADSKVLFSTKVDEIPVLDSSNVSQNVSTSSAELMTSSSNGSASSDVNRVLTKPLVETSLSIESLITAMTSLSNNNQSVSLTISCNSLKRPSGDKKAEKEVGVILEVPQDSNGSRNEFRYVYDNNTGNEDERGYSKFITHTADPIIENNEYDRIEENELLDFPNKVSSFDMEYLNVALPESYSSLPSGSPHDFAQGHTFADVNNYVNVDTFLIRGSTLRGSLV